MFIRHKKNVKLLLEFHDTFEDHSNDPTAPTSGYDICEYEIDLFDDLKKMHDKTKERHTNDAAKSKTHKIEITINGYIHGDKIKNLKIDSLEKLEEFITKHAPQAEKVKSKHHRTEFISPML